MTGLAYPDISPIIFEIGPFGLRWYSMAYLIGILAGWWLVALRNKKYNLSLTKQNMEDIAFYMTLGIILGGRIGYILFYGREHFLQNPLEIFEIWHGGMSFHGGIIGVIVALWLVSRKIKYGFLRLTDTISPVVPIGIFLGRLANFANDELWGRASDLPWAIRFPRGGYIPRHPSQIYEALLEGLLMFIILNIAWRFKFMRERQGLISALFLLCYAGFRAFCEQFREPDAQIGFLWLNTTMGQILSAPALILGVFLVYRAFMKKET